MILLLISALVADTLLINSSVISSESATERLPVAVTSLDAPALQAGESSGSLPQRLSLLPSVVSVSEGGTGVGYTSFSVRGISGYHTNVTLNGIALGDSESQEVFWVNIPALASILSSAQLQRGLGTAACGPGAFGASLNMETAKPSGRGGSACIGYGSFNTGTVSVRAFSNEVKYGLFADAALNVQHTDGYIRNAPANVWSAFANVGWQGRDDIVQAVFLQGWQRSAVTWNGVPFDVYPVDRTFNVSEGDTDNYRQSHLQLNHRHRFCTPLRLNTVLNYTHGYGWYDIDGAKDCLKNDLYAVRSELSYSAEALYVAGAAYLSCYAGQHWNNPETYSDTADKSEADLSVRAELSPLRRLSVFGEVQYRGVTYNLYQQSHRWNFCNPRIGISWSPSSMDKLYAFAAMGHREPARADFDANPYARRETLYDFELSYEYEAADFCASINLYDMEYRDMLLETGDVNSQGYAVRDNVAKAHRRGVETALTVIPAAWLRLDANGTFSDNRYDGGLLLLSPSAVGSVSVTVEPSHRWKARFDAKFVGKQYYNNTGLDITGAKSSEVPGYACGYFSASREFRLRGATLTLSAYLNNVFDARYYAYAYNYGVFPAAMRNGSLKLTLGF